MTDRRHSIGILFWLLLAGHLLTGQERTLANELEALHHYPALYLMADDVSVLRNVHRARAGMPGHSLSGINPVEHLAFFCKLEVLSDRKTRIPFRVRLGTVEYVDRLERKVPGALFFTEDQKVNPHRQYAPH